MNRGLQILLSKYEHLDFDVSQRNGCKGKLLGSMTPNEALEYENIRIITNQEVYFTRQDSGDRDSVRSIERHSVPFAPQSAQYLFSSSFNNSDKIVWFVFCFCPLSFCVREDIIEGNEHQQPLCNFVQTKMA